MAAHGIGTARAFQVNPVAGAYAGIAMALNALLTSIIGAVLARWLIGRRPRARRYIAPHR